MITEIPVPWRSLRENYLPIIGSYREVLLAQIAASYDEVSPRSKEDPSWNEKKYSVMGRKLLPSGPMQSKHTKEAPPRRHQDSEPQGGNRIPRTTRKTPS